MTTHETCAWWILVKGEPVPVSASEWADWWTSGDHTIARDEIGGAKVLTGFLGLDRRVAKDDSPRLWQTTVLGFPGGLVWMSATRDEALEAHAQAVEKASAWKQAEMFAKEKSA